MADLGWENRSKREVTILPLCHANRRPRGHTPWPHPHRYNRGLATPRKPLTTRLMPILNVSAYKFVSMDDVEALRDRLRARTRDLRLKGTILLAPEGINLFIAGEQAQVERFLALLAEEARFAGLETKLSWSEEQPFNRMLVKTKREIITLRRPDVDPSRTPAPRIAPLELKRWLDQGRQVLLLDTRNAFEVALGTFNGAAGLGLKSFSELPAAAQAIDPRWKDLPVVTFCTGGIRCEKAAPLLVKEGFREVYQLEGGILKYFEQCGGAHFHGECFIFDKRVALGPDLQPTGTAQCYACQSVLTLEDQRRPEYVFGKSCHHCAGHLTTRRAGPEAAALPV